MQNTEERICLDARRHGVVLARPLVRALALAGTGAVAIWLSWPYSVAGAALLAVAAIVALRSVVRWDRTRLVVTSEKVLVVHGVLRRSSASVPLRAIDALEVEQSLAGRVLGYGTLTLGPLEITCVPQPGSVLRLVSRLCG